MRDAFLRTFCCNMFDEVYMPPCSGLPNFLQVKQVFLDLLDTRKESPTSVALILRIIWATLMSMSLGDYFLRCKRANIYRLGARGI